MSSHHFFPSASFHFGAGGLEAVKPGTSNFADAVKLDAETERGLEENDETVDGEKEDEEEGGADEEDDEEEEGAAFSLSSCHFTCSSPSTFFFLVFCSPFVVCSCFFFAV
jgi:hypothetical protein